MKQYKDIKAKVIKLFSCSTPLSMKFIMLINVKVPIAGFGLCFPSQSTAIVDILTFISVINTTSKCLKARKVFFQHFSFYEQ